MSVPDPDLSRQAVKLFRATRFAEAEPLLRRLVDSDPPDWQHLMLLGLCRQALGDVAEARSWLERAVELGDGQPITHYYLGRLEAQQGRIHEAGEQFAQAIAIDPNFVDARTEMGLLALDRGDLERAITEFRTALRACASHVPTLVGLARALLDRGEAEEAETHAALAVRIAPGNAAAQAAMGSVFARKGHDDFAEQSFRNALKADPNCREAHLGLARVLRARGLTDAALGHYHRVLRLGPVRPPLLVEMASALTRFGDFGQARGLLAQGRQRFPKDAALAAAQAELMLTLDEPDAAEAALAGFDPDRVEVLLARSQVLRRLDRSAEAIALLERALERDDLHPDLRARLALELADLYSLEAPDQPQRARAPIAGLLDRETPTVDAVLVWSTICERAGNLGAAISALGRLLDGGRVAGGERAWCEARMAHCQDLADRREQAWQHWSRAARGRSPHHRRLAEREADLTRQWLARPSIGQAELADDAGPVPVLVGGWAGSGREIVLAALRRHPDVVLLDPDRAEARIDALGGPAGAALASEWTPEERRLARKRYLRGAAACAGALLLDPDWRPAGALATMLQAFGRLRVIGPDVGWYDQLLQWQVYGYDDIETLAEAYRDERALLARLADHPAIEWIRLSRDRLAEDPAATLTGLFAALGLAPSPAAVAAGRRFYIAHPLVQPGAGQRYREWIDAAFGPEQRT